MHPNPLLSQVTGAPPPWSAAGLANPYPWFQDALEGDRVVHDERANIWHLFRYDDVRDFLRDPQTWSVAKRMTVHDQIALSYSDSDNFDFVSVAGAATVVTEVAKKKELWKPAVQAWFPEGADSSQNVLIKVAPDHAEYWDSKSNRLVQLFTLAKALATGTPPNDMGEHRNVTLPAGDKTVNSVV